MKGMAFGRFGGRSALERAQLAASSGDTQLALKELQLSRRKLSRTDGDSWLLLGDTATLVDDLAIAGDAYTSACACASVRSTALARLAGLHISRDEIANAQSVVSQGLSEYPEDQALAWLGALVAEKAEGLDAAIEQLVTLTLKAPGYLQAFRDLGRLYGVQRDTYACVEAWRHVVEQSPQDAEALTALGIALSEAEEHEYAIETLVKVVEAHENHGPYLANLGLAYLRADQLQNARVTLEAAHRAAPEDPQVLVNLGSVLVNCDDLNRALMMTRKALELAPDWANAYYNLGHVLSERGDLRDSAKAFARAAQLAPDDVDILLASAPRGNRDVSLAGTLSGMMPVGNVMELLRARERTGRLIVGEGRSDSFIRLNGGRISSAHASELDLRATLRDYDFAPAVVDSVARSIDPNDRPEEFGALLCQQSGTSNDTWLEVLRAHTRKSCELLYPRITGGFRFQSEAIEGLGLSLDPRDVFFG